MHNYIYIFFKFHVFCWWVTKYLLCMRSITYAIKHSSLWLFNIPNFLSIAQHERISRLKLHICWFAFSFESTPCFYCVPSLPHPVSSPDPPSNNWIIIQFDILNVDLLWWDKLCPRSTLPHFASRIMEVNNGPPLSPKTEAQSCSVGWGGAFIILVHKSTWSWLSCVATHNL